MKLFIAHLRVIPAHAGMTVAIYELDRASAEVVRLVLSRKIASFPLLSFPLFPSAVLRVLRGEFRYPPW